LVVVVVGGVVVGVVVAGVVVTVVVVFLPQPGVETPTATNSPKAHRIASSFFTGKPILSKRS
jgi:hypothetical protein